MIDMHSRHEVERQKTGNIVRVCANNYKTTFAIKGKLII